MNNQVIVIAIRRRTFIPDYFGGGLCHDSSITINIKDSGGTLKIAAPAPGSQFNFGDTINFVGSMTGNVGYFEWLDNGVLFAQLLTAQKSDLAVGTHTITFRGRTSNGQTLWDSITISIIPIGKVQITSPASGTQFNIGDNINFVGTYTGNVTNFTWESTIQGNLGGGISLSRSDLQPGTHTIALRGTGLSGQLSDTVTILIKPLTIELTLNPPEVRPQATPLGNQNTNITVTVKSGGVPITQPHQVHLIATAVATSGGHLFDHVGNRPVGSFTTDTGFTNNQGIFSTTYTPSVFGGSETITVNSVVYPDIQASATLDVRVLGLVLLPERNYYVQVGGRDAHPGPNDRNPHERDNPNTNHYGTQVLVDLIQNLATAYNTQFPNIPNNQLLHINDMSLPNGGKFDIDGSWGGDHRFHRIGLNVDIETAGRLTPAEQTWLRDEVRQRPADFNDGLTRTHGGNHLHLQSNN